MMAIKLVQKLDDIRISVGTAERVASAVEAEDQLPRSHRGLLVNRSRHLRGDEN